MPYELDIMLDKHAAENFDYCVFLSEEEFEAFKKSKSYFRYSYAIWDNVLNWWQVFFVRKMTSKSNIMALGVQIGKQLAA